MQPEKIGNDFSECQQSSTNYKEGAVGLAGVFKNHVLENSQQTETTR